MKILPILVIHISDEQGREHTLYDDDFRRLQMLGDCKAFDGIGLLLSDKKPWDVSRLCSASQTWVALFRFLDGDILLNNLIPRLDFF